MTEPKKRPARADVKESILEAAEEEFFDNGYQATTLASIAERAGFTKGAVYSNYGSKLDLLLAIVQRRIDNFLHNSVSQVLERATDVNDLAKQLAQLTYDEQRWNSLAVEITVIASRDEKIAEAYTAMRRRLNDGITALLNDYLKKAGERMVPGHSADTLAKLLISLSNIMSINGQVDSQTYTRESREKIFRVVLAGVIES